MLRFRTNLNSILIPDNFKISSSEKIFVQKRTRKAFFLKFYHILQICIHLFCLKKTLSYRNEFAYFGHVVRFSVRRLALKSIGKFLHPMVK